MIKRTYVHDFVKPLNKVFAAWTDADFLVAMMVDAGSRDIEVTVEAGPEDVLVTIDREVPTDAPALIRSVVGAWTRIEQVETWTGKKGGPWTAVLVVDPLGKPAKGGATLVLEKTGRRCRCSVTSWAECSVPLVGRVVEALMIEDSQKMIRDECAYIDRHA